MIRFYLTRHKSRNPETATPPYRQQARAFRGEKSAGMQPDCGCGLPDAVPPVAAGWKAQQLSERRHSEPKRRALPLLPNDEVSARSVPSYAIPNVVLTGINRERIPLRTLLGKSPLILNFMCTSCAETCLSMGMVLSEAQAALAQEGNKVRMVSISIDPQQDTPERLKAYARRFRAGPEWQFLTGSESDSIAVQQAFGVYDIDTLNHVPATFLHVLPGKPWVHLMGLVTPDELLSEYRRLVS